MFDISDRALHSELLSKISSWVSSRNEFSRVETRRVEHHFFVIFGNFGKRLLPKLAKTNFHDFSQFFCKKSRKIAIFAIFASLETFGKHGNYRNISEVLKTAISETRENKNFGKNVFCRALISDISYFLRSKKGGLFRSF